MMNDVLKMVGGILLSILMTGVGFIWTQIADLKKEVVNHRVSLAQLITPDGVIIPAPTNSESRNAISERVTRLEVEVIHLKEQRKLN